MQLHDIAVLLLASGLSRRFGDADKLLAPFRGQALGRYSANLFTSVPELRRYAVTPAEDSKRRALYTNLGWHIIDNPEPEKGQGYSIALGIKFIQNSGVKGVIILLADMPFLTITHINALLERVGERDAVISYSGGKLVPPVFFSYKTFNALCALEGDKGAKSVFMTLDNTDIYNLPAHAAIDIDTREELTLYSKSVNT